MKKPLSKYAPRDLRGGHWYYVNDRSIDLIAHGPDTSVTVSVTLHESDLVKMCSELRVPRKKRAAPKRRRR